MTTLLLANARVWTGAERFDGGVRRHEAIAVTGSRVAAVGALAELRARFPGADELDAGGRTVVPGVVDGHCHAVRGGATWHRERHWGDLRTVAEALADVRRAVRTQPEGSWITAIGGWHASQFGGRVPSRADLDEAAPRNPVYVQSLYEEGIANSPALELVGEHVLAALPDGDVERDASGRPTGRVVGIPAFTAFLVATGAPNVAEQRQGLRAMMHDFAALGMTGLTDPGGFGMGRAQYQALAALQAEGELALRMRLFLSATDPGHEAEQIDDWLGEAPVGSDEMLRVLGIGEVAHYGCHDFEGLDGFHPDAFRPTPESAADLAAISRRVAERGAAMHVHAVGGDVAAHVLDVWERLDRDIPLRPLRFSLAHGDLLRRADAERMARLGIGLVVDDRQVFRFDASARGWGHDALRSAPPIGMLEQLGVPLGLGTDATRASVANPWIAIWSLVEGRSIDGVERRAPEHRVDRTRALEITTTGNAWFSAEEHERGRLVPGALADLAVLDRDYFRVPPEEIPAIRSELTVVGGRVSYSGGEIADATRVPAALAPGA